MSNEPEQNQFISPLAKYNGEFSPQQLTFNANLQEFAQRVSLLCGLETNGKVSAQDAYKEIKQLWKSLKASKQALLDAQNPTPPELPEG